MLKPLSGSMSLLSLLPQKPGKEQQGVAVANRSLRTFLLNSGSTEPAAWSPDLERLLSTLHSLSKGADGRLFFQMKPSRSQGHIEPRLCRSQHAPGGMGKLWKVTCL